MRIQKDFATIFHSYLNSKRTMNKYEIIIYWSDEDKAFIAELPKLAGCMADGETYQKALAKAEVIIQEWIETAQESGRQIPEPKGGLFFSIEFYEIRIN